MAGPHLPVHHRNSRPSGHPLRGTSWCPILRTLLGRLRYTVQYSRDSRIRSEPDCPHWEERDRRWGYDLGGGSRRYHRQRHLPESRRTNVSAWYVGYHQHADVVLDHHFLLVDVLQEAEEAGSRGQEASVGGYGRVQVCSVRDVSCARECDVVRQGVSAAEICFGFYAWLFQIAGSEVLHDGLCEGQGGCVVPPNFV